MISFSRRHGIKALKTIVQIESMDEELRNGLWNAWCECYWADEIKDIQPVEDLFINLHKSFFKKPIDTLPWVQHERYSDFREFFFNCEWYEVYDVIEFCAVTFVIDFVNDKFTALCNDVLEAELSGYRFVGRQLAKITSEEEIESIEQSLDLGRGLRLVSDHFKRAFELLADRKMPDYRNSIKESISAVEAVCRLITRNEKAELSQALKAIERQVAIHGALKQAFTKLYGYTSDAEGIRHALMNEPSLDFEDAKFMLVSCSAFTNYLVSKAGRAGVEL